jgi:hypothetical protein
MYLFFITTDLYLIAIAVRYKSKCIYFIWNDINANLMQSHIWKLVQIGAFMQISIRICSAVHDQ